MCHAEALLLGGPANVAGHHHSCRATIDHAWTSFLTRPARTCSVYSYECSYHAGHPGPSGVSERGARSPACESVVSTAGVGLGSQPAGCKGGERREVARLTCGANIRTRTRTCACPSACFGSLIIMAESMVTLASSLLSNPTPIIQTTYCVYVRGGCLGSVWRHCPGASAPLRVLLPACVAQVRWRASLQS